jgi:hypothetical protein
LGTPLVGASVFPVHGDIHIKLNNFVLNNIQKSYHNNCNIVLRLTVVYDIVNYSTMKNKTENVIVRHSKLVLYLSLDRSVCNEAIVLCLTKKRKIKTIER